MKRIKIKKLILHIGSHKTGTTYIQRYFKENGYIQNHKIVLYPKSGCDVLFGHHEICSAIRNKSQNLESIFESMAREVMQSHEVIFLSSENFEYLNECEITELISYFDYEQINVIYLYRNWTPLLYAMWQEEIKHGSAVTYDSYCLRHIGFPLSSNLLNYSTSLENYAEIVSRENISIASYDVLIDAGIDLADFICARIGIESVVTSTSGEKVNSSFDSSLVEIIRIMNVLASRENYEKSYLPKHLYINKACSGAAGSERDRRIRKAMSSCLSQRHDFSQSFSFRSVYTDFYDKYSHCFVDGTNDINCILDLKCNVSTVVDTGYLLDEKIISDLYSAWTDVRSAMSASNQKK